MNDPITIHIVFNAHIDPIWLWPLRSGIDEVLATCRSACDRLDKHPDLIFTRGEAWVYQQVERIDPALFRRIRNHVASGQWEIVGGWYVQPDCNLPSGFALAKQIELGKRYFIDRFGLFPDVAYNVDSFGHAATLPTFMRRAGQKYYVMMRPQEQEMSLPASLFRWREREGSDEVVTFRIPGWGYGTPEPLTVETVRMSLRGMLPGIGHTMLFAGIGDHGGGPTEEQIAWFRANWQNIDGCRLVFSSPRKFFAAIEPFIERLPIVTGELQYHAIGCYSVHRPVKTALRRAEHLLAQAENFFADKFEPETRREIDAAWERVCLHQFHDTLGGTCLPSAYQRILGDLGSAASTAQELLEVEWRRQLSTMVPDPLQRIIVHNASDSAYAGCVQLDPWLERSAWNPQQQLIDEQGHGIPYQLVDPEANMASQYITGLLFRLEIPANQSRIVRIDPKPAPRALPSQAVTAQSDRIASASAEVRPNDRQLTMGAITLAPIELHQIADETDTWSHGIDRYGESNIVTPVWNGATIIEHGPLRAAMIQHGTIDRSSFTAEWRVFADDPYAELILRVQWNQQRSVLKLVVPMPIEIASRTDGICGGHLVRPSIGREQPLRDWTMIEFADGKHLGIVCPEGYALDATPRRLRFTLVRSPALAHHDPLPQPFPRAIHADQGLHEYRIRFMAGEVTAALLDQQATMMQRALLVASVTIGMPSHPTSPKY